MDKSADHMNSIVERIAGVNPSKLAAEAEGKEFKEESQPKQQPQAQGSMAAPSPHQSFPAQQSSAPSGYVPISELQRMQQAYESRLSELERRFQALEGKGRNPSNRGYNSTVYGRDMPDDEPEQYYRGGDDRREGGKKQESSMGSNNVIGTELTEFRKLAGMMPEDPRVNLTEGVGVEVEDEYIDSDAQGYVDKERLWADFLASEGIDVEDFNRFLENAIRTEDEDDIEYALEVERMFENFMGKLFTSDKPGTGQKKVAGDVSSDIGQKGKSAQSNVRSRPVGGRGGNIKFPGEKRQGFQSLSHAEYDGDPLSEDEFLCDDDGEGNPRIPWDRIMKAYNIKKRKR